jgi:hemolysin activation/secretion protein
MVIQGINMQERRGLSRLIFIMLSLLGTLWVQNLHAQTDQQALEQIRQAIQLEEQRRTNERRRLDDTQRTHTALPPVESAPVPEIPDGGSCFTANTISVDGVELFSYDIIADQYSTFINTCISLADINTLVARLTQLYIDAGYVTSRAYIPPQDLSTGELRISVIEGYVESVRIDGGSARMLATAFPSLVGKPLNLRQIEQGLDQLNRLRSASATIQFVPGEQLGATEVVISYRANEPASINLGYNNSGQKSTGIYKVNAGAGWDNPLGINDFVHINHSTNARDEGAGKKSTSTSFHYSLPYGYWNFSLDASQFEYANRVTGSATTFETRGSSDVLQLSADRLLARDQNSKTILSIHLKEQRGKNYIDDVLLLTSSRDDSVFGMNISKDIYLPGNKTLITSLGYVRGLQAKYHSESVSHAEDLPEEKFEKLLLDVSLMGAVQWLENTWQWRSEIHGQYSSDLLYSSEAFSIGSQYTVRGFKEDGLSGDSGIYWRNEISLPAFPFARAPQFRTEPFIGLDTGIIDNGVTTESLTGWAFGLRLSGAHVSAQIAYAEPLTHPDYLTLDNHALDFSVSFSRYW